MSRIERERAELDAVAERASAGRILPVRTDACDGADAQRVAIRPFGETPGE
jgi:hypothetical protein